MEIKHEDLGDLPLLGHLINQSPLSDCLNEHYPVHGNWRGPSIGQLVTGWLMYILSECDHRLYTVEAWAQSHLNTLRQVLSCPDLESSAFQDDRLGNLLERFALDQPYEAFQSDYNAKLLHLYRLDQSRVRIDSFNAPSYRKDKAGGLFQFGYQKSHQADMPNVKTMMVTLDPLSLPIASYVFPGNQTDDRNYIPTIEQARQSLDQDGLLYVGDTKLGSLENRSYLARSANYYLCPLSYSFYARHDLEQHIEQAIGDKDQLHCVYEPPDKTGHKRLVAQVYELPVRQCIDAQQATQWTERMVLVRSIAHAEAQSKMIHERLQKARKELVERFLPRKYRQTWTVAKIEKAQAFVAKVLKKYRVQGLLEIELTQEQEATPDTPLGIQTSLDQEAIQRTIRLAAWRLYVTNAPVQNLPVKDVLRCYRGQYRIEQQFHRLLTKTTNLLPIYLKNESRIIALLRLLSLALQFVSIIQYSVRKTLVQNQQHLTDLVPGNKNRKVHKPTTEAILKRFKGITAIWVQEPDQPLWAVVKNMEPVHYQILNLLRCPDDLYLNLVRAYQNVNELA